MGPYSWTNPRPSHRPITHTRMPYNYTLLTFTSQPVLALLVFRFFVTLPEVARMHARRGARSAKTQQYRRGRTGLEHDIPSR